MSGEIQVLLAALDEAYDRKGWYGTGLRGSLRGVTPQEAAWRPAPGAHNIAELVVHTAYWKYAVWRLLSREKRGSFAPAGSNWFEREEVTAASLRADLARLGTIHRQLRAVVAEIPPRLLSRAPVGKKYSRRALVSGVAQHDVYHAGQIQLLKRLMRRA